MSMCYWTVEGVGLDTSVIRPYLNNRKLLNFLSQQLPDDEDVLEWKNRIDLKGFDIDVFLWGQPFENLADILTHFDDTGTLCYGEVDGADYFYYPPSMPWQIRENDPKSIDDVHKRIIDAVMAITDMSADQIAELIDDDLFFVGCG